MYFVEQRGSFCEEIWKKTISLEENLINEFVT